MDKESSIYCDLEGLNVTSKLLPFHVVRHCKTVKQSRCVTMHVKQSDIFITGSTRCLILTGCHMFIEQGKQRLEIFTK